MAKKVAKKSGHRKIRAAALGEPVEIKVSHKELIPVVTRLLLLVEAVSENLHPAATPEQHEYLRDVRAGLENAAVAVAGIKCPNPMYVMISVDKHKLYEIAKFES